MSWWNYCNIARSTSTSVPSSITVFALPDTISDIWGSSQPFVLTLGLTCLSHLHPGSSVTLAIVVFPKFTISIFSFSNVSVSSGDFRLFVRIFDADVIQDSSFFLMSHHFILATGIWVVSITFWFIGINTFSNVATISGLGKKPITLAFLEPTFLKL